MTIDTDFAELLARTCVDSFSKHVFGVPYEKIQGVLYPVQPYRSFSISKRAGGRRLIQSPKLALKQLQRRLVTYLQRIGPQPKGCAHGFRARRSIVSNAAQHCSLRTRFLLNLDVEDFFPSITFYRVRGVFLSAPFRFSHPVASLVAHICTYRGLIPQGAPTSPYISNIVARSLDRNLMALAGRHRATYTRYVDDITFSFSVRSAAALPGNICTFDSGSLILGAELLEEISKAGFKLNESKTRMSMSSRRMEVTGLKINRFPNVRRRFIDEIRGALHACETYGYEAANIRWLSGYGSPDGISRARSYRSIKSSGLPDLINFLRGKILFLKMVRGDSDLIYNRLAERFNSIAVGVDAKLLKLYPKVGSNDELRRACYVVMWEALYVDPSTGSKGFVAGQGTGFLYSGGRLVTCEHVFNDDASVDGSKISVNINSPHIEDMKCYAIDFNGVNHELTLLHADRHRDLAVLQFDRGPPTSRYLGPSHSRPRTGSRGFLVGYPDYTPGRPVNVVASEVTNRYARQGLGRVELSSTIRAGYSGGPFVDESFGLVGIALKGATQDSGTDECLASEELEKWLSSL